jgi:hypothetical protein
MKSVTADLMLALLLALAVTTATAQEAVTTEEENPAVESRAEERPEATERRALTDVMQLESSSIRGNQELPRVLYIVPWKDPSLGDVTGKPVNSLVDEVLAPLDRDVFLRQTKYFGQLYASPETGVSE